MNDSTKGNRWAQNFAPFGGSINEYPALATFSDNFLKLKSAKKQVGFLFRAAGSEIITKRRETLERLLSLKKMSVNR